MSETYYGFIEPDLVSWIGRRCYASGRMLNNKECLNHFENFYVVPV